MKETQVQSLGWEDPLEEKMVPTPVFLPGKSHGQRSPAAYSPWGHRELDTTEHTCTTGTTGVLEFKILTEQRSLGLLCTAWPLHGFPVMPLFEVFSFYPPS